MRDEQLVWVKEGALWQIELATGDESRLSGELPESVNAMTMTMKLSIGSMIGRCGGGSSVEKSLNRSMNWGIRDSTPSQRWLLGS